MIYIKRNILLAKLETTYNVDPVPTAAANAILVENLNVAPAQSKSIQQGNVSKGTFGPGMSLYAGSLWQITFDMRVKGSGTAGTAPELSVPLQVCGLKETVVPITSVSYKPSSNYADHKSGAFYHYEGGKLYKFTGVRGDCSFEGKSGDTGMFKFTLTGHLASYADATVPAPTLRNTQPIKFAGVGLTVGGVSHSIAALSLAPGNTVSMQGDVNGVDSFGEIIITDRNPTGSIDPLDKLKATHDFIAEWQTDAALAINTGVIGSVAGNRYQLQLPATRYTDFGRTEREGLRAVDLKFQALETSAGDDNFTLTFT